VSEELYSCLDELPEWSLNKGVKGVDQELGSAG